MVSAPSGAGKTSLIRALLKDRPAIELSVSYTTRAPRPGERDGEDYLFVAREEFERRRAGGEFLEWAQVHGNLYGTSAVWVGERINAGHDLMLEIDHQGAAQVRRLLPHAVGIFIAPPSIDELRRRLVARGQDTATVIEARVQAAADELRQVHQFEYVIINQDFAMALSQLTAVVDAAGVRYATQRARHPEIFRHWDAG